MTQEERERLSFQGTVYRTYFFMVLAIFAVILACGGAFSSNGHKENEHAAE